MAREFGVDESCVRRAVAQTKKMEDLDPVISGAMGDMGMEMIPTYGWVKTHTPDEHGRTYSFALKPGGVVEGETFEEKLEQASERMSALPRVHLPPPESSEGGEWGRRVVFIPINDLHAGAYAWHRETGYGDWDIEIAIRRLRDWAGRLIARTPVCGECILYYNGDTLHMNGEQPFTPASGHVLDKDGRNLKVVDLTAEAIIAVTDMAAAKHVKVRLVIKRGNHDEDSYIALLMAAKWRYFDQDNVIVELDPSPYWVWAGGNLLLFGHHGDRIKPVHLVMKVAADHRELWGKADHVVIWTGHLHSQKIEQFPGAIWERASCWTEPDAYGAKWGANAQAQAVVYDLEDGETDRFTIRQRRLPEDR